MKKKISNWNNFPTVLAEEKYFGFREELSENLNNKDGLIPRGMGRCYGDASLSDKILSTLKFNRILEFDPIKGILTCQSGITLEKILEVIVPKGWFLPVTPGTKFITLGGAIASNVHGKNHHKEGAFSNHIIEMEICCQDGKSFTCSEEINPELFHATCGGMGLTGIILNAKFRLKKIETSYIKLLEIRSKNLEEFFSLFQEHHDYTYSVAWIDSLAKGSNFGRGILLLGEHAQKRDLNDRMAKKALRVPEKRKLKVSFFLPSCILNYYSIKAFNTLYYYKSFRKSSMRIIDYDAFFYPLDSIIDWNKMYGKKGFIQYQFVLPLDKSQEGIERILGLLREKGLGSFLTVLKLFGEGEKLLSFPMRGYTLALDIPIRKNLFDLVDELDKIVLEYGGRIYLSKDARMKKDIFWNSYPEDLKFREIVKKYNPDFKFKSLLSKRLSISK